jgi:hypothetical protein
MIEPARGPASIVMFLRVSDFRRMTMYLALPRFDVDPADRFNQRSVQQQLVGARASREQRKLRPQRMTKV